jgi:hypothetical protein
MSNAGDAIDNKVTCLRRYYHPIQKDYATFLQTSEEMGGEYTLIEVEVAPGGGNEPHYRQDLRRALRGAGGRTGGLVPSFREERKS